MNWMAELAEEVSETEEPPACPMGDGYGAYLGQLGNLVWFRCVSCGIDFNDGRR